MAQIEIRQLTKKFMQGEDEVIAVNNISLQINKGEMVAITGQSGSGKTTLLNLIGGTERASAGSVMIDGVEITSVNDTQLANLRRKKIGYIYQDFRLIPMLTVEENIMMPVLLDSQKPDENYIKEILQFLGLENRKTHLPSELSGGQRQRVAIGRAIVNHPVIVLADEPTGNLDRKMADEIMQYLMELKAKGITVLLVTHEEEYANMCDRKILICDGKI